MDWLIILLAVLVAGNMAMVFVLWRKGQEPPAPLPPPDTSSFMLLQNQMKNLQEAVKNDLLEVVRGVAETKESTKQVLTVAEQLNNLEKVLKKPKAARQLGRGSLELILSNVLPGQYEPQYKFKDGEKVDFIVRTQEGLIPVDAKFPLENYMRLINEGDQERRSSTARSLRTTLKSASTRPPSISAPRRGHCRLPLCTSRPRGFTTTCLTTTWGWGSTRATL
jgi:hypothetical protein